MKKFIKKFLPVILTAAFLFSFVPATVNAVPVMGASISVSGEGTIYLAPDIATVTLGVETQDTDPLAAQQQNSAAIADVISAVTALNVDEADIQTLRFNMHPMQHWTEDRGVITTGYTVSNHISVTVRNLDSVGEILAVATTAGANAASSIVFEISDSAAAYNEALALAVENAVSKAQAIADALGVNLGSVISVSESGVQAVRPFPVMAMADAAFEVDMGFGARAAGVPVQAGELTVNAQVHVTFSINP